MKTGSISNFCGGDPVDVSASEHPSCGPLVLISQNVGSCSFHHNMTANQAREMASALLEAVGELERLALQAGLTAITCEAA